MPTHVLSMAGPHESSLVRDESGLIVEWDIQDNAASQGELIDRDSNPSGSESRFDATPYRRFDIQLTCRLPLSMPAGPSTDIAIPRVLSSIVVKPADSDFSLLNGNGTTAPGNAENEVVSEIGSVDQLKLSTRNRPASLSPADWTLDDVTALVTVHPKRMDVRARLQMSVPTGTAFALPTSNITLHLPIHSTISRITVPNLAATTSREMDGDELLVPVVFDPSGLTSIAVDVEFTMPVTSVDGEVRIPAMDFVGREHLSLRVVQILGVVPTTGYRLAPFSDNLASEQVQALTPGEFARSWSVGETGTGPAFAYKLTTPTVLRFRQSPLKPLKVANIHQSVTLQPRTLLWTAEVLLDVDLVATAMHELWIDPHVSIESVSVQQDSAERMVHWSRSQDGRLMLFLSDELTGFQKISIRGVRPIQQRDVVPLPECLLTDGRVLSTDLQITNDSPLEFDVLRLKPDGEFETLTEKNAAGKLGTFELGTETAPSHVRIRPGPQAFVADQLLVLRPTAETADQLHVEIIVRAEDAALDDVGILLPAELAGIVDEAEINPLPVMSQPLGDRQQLLTFHSGGTESGEMRISMSFDIGPIEGESWSLPQITVTTALAGEYFLAVDSDLSWKPHGGQYEAVSENLLPQWVSSVLSQDHTGSLLHFRSPEGVWILGKDDADEHDIHAPVAESIVWSCEDGRLSGVTTWWLHVQHTGPVSVDTQEDVSISAMSLNGIIPESPAHHGSAEIHLSKSPDLQQVRLWWTNDTPQRGLTRVVTVPRLDRVSEEVHLVAISHPPAVDLWGVTGLQVRPRTEWDMTLASVSENQATSFPESSISHTGRFRSSGTVEVPRVLHAEGADSELLGLLVNGQRRVQYQAIDRGQLSLLLLTLLIGALLCVLQVHSIRGRLKSCAEWCGQHPASGCLGLGALVLFGGQWLAGLLLLAAPLVTQGRDLWLKRQLST